MIPGGVDPRKMDALMKQMGIRSEQIEADSVVIETPSGRIVIEQPQVMQVTMQGQKSFQISGVVRTEDKSSEDDAKMVMEQTGCSEEEAKAALEKSGGDIAQAIVSLSESKE
jgi:nascent polypeptide-associated complex subunit alpha